MKIKSNHPAIIEGRTVFQGSLYEPQDSRMVLKSAKSNTKLSGLETNIIQKGRWKGMPMFSLTLEERKTCPKDCFHWANCYGNNMYLAKRVKHGKELQDKLNDELEELSVRYPSGFVIRLHILGDFYSVNYVRFWYKQLSKHHQLRIFGYSARISGNIFAELVKTIRNFPTRFVIRFSTDKKLEEDVTYARSQFYYGKGSTVCPEQTGEVNSCIRCALCFVPNGSITFMNH